MDLGRGERGVREVCNDAGTPGREGRMAERSVHIGEIYISEAQGGRENGREGG